MKKPLLSLLVATGVALGVAMPAAQAASGRDVAAGLVIGGLVGAAIASQPRVVEREVVVQQPAVVYPVAQPVAPQVVQPSQCYYPGPPAAYGPCPGGAAYPGAPQPQSYVVPQPQVVYTQPAVVYTQPATVIYTSPRYYPVRPSYGYHYHGGHRGHGHGGFSVRY